jgi:hypothetical protein
MMFENINDEYFFHHRSKRPHKICHKLSHFVITFTSSKIKTSYKVIFLLGHIYIMVTCVSIINT